jgi:hypothetical protein
MKPATFTRHTAFTLIAASIAVFIAVSAHCWISSVDAHAKHYQSADHQPLNGRVFLDTDAYYWLAYANQLHLEDTWRIRRTDLDNVPYGRPVHWSQSIAWFLLGAGRIVRAISGDPIRESIEAGAMYMQPVLFLCFLLPLGWFIYRRVGLLAALLWMLIMATQQHIQDTFHPLKPDHHSLHLFFMAGSLILIIIGGMGWVSKKEDSDQASWIGTVTIPQKAFARRCFLLSAVLGGLGIWSGATVQIFGVGLIIIAGMLLTILMPTGSESDQTDMTYDPTAWKIWGRVGAAVSLIMYWVEYGFTIPAMRLEVNHPLYALSWLCAGEWMARLSSIRMADRRVTPIEVSQLTLLGFGALLLPLLLIAGPPEWHAMRDDLMRRMHDYILEFNSLSLATGGKTLNSLWSAFLLLPFFMMGAIWLASPARSRIEEWAALWFSFILTFSYFLLGHMQIRWLPAFGMMSAWLTALTMSVLWRSVRSHWLGRILYGVLVVLIIGQPVIWTSKLHRQFQSMKSGDAVHMNVLVPLLHRDMAARIGERLESHDLRIMADAELAGPLHYYAGARSVSSLYWENMDGLHEAAAFMTDTTGTRAADIARTRGLTHILIPNNVHYARMHLYIRKGQYSDEAAWHTLAGRLLSHPQRWPDWVHLNPNDHARIFPDITFRGHSVYGLTGTRRFMNRPLFLEIDAEVLAHDEL